jgi:thiol-disulfide isomerase/thioredoxin
MKTKNLLEGKTSCPFQDHPGYFKTDPKFDCNIKNENGESFSIKDLRGNVVIITIFTTWCRNCPSVLQNLDSLVEKFRVLQTKNVKIIALNMGSELLDEIKLHYKINNIQLLETYRSIPHKSIAIQGVPVSFIFDKEGNFVCGYLGRIDYDSQEFINFIVDLANG